MELTIRPYRPEDLEACRELWRELTQHHREIYADPGIGGADPGAHFDKYLTRPDFAAAWVAEEEGAIVGLAGLLLEGEEAEIEPVVVRSGHRSRGIGRRLLEHVLEEAGRRGSRSVSIRPVARNASAIRSFFEAGFTVLGRIEMFRTLDPAAKEWKPGITIHGHDFRY